MLKKLNKGATMIEYALIASLIAVVAISVMRNVGIGIESKMQQVEAELNASADTGGSENTGA